MLATIAEEFGKGKTVSQIVRKGLLVPDLLITNL